MKTPRFCLDCGSAVSGRADKKYCSDACRIQYHNRNHRITQNLAKNVNRIIRTNYLILERCIGNQSERELPLNELEIRGFRFGFLTHLSHLPDGRLRCSIYDLSWEKINDKNCLIQGPEKSAEKRSLV
ncbi:MAG TPA: hypothetical protein DCD96_04040 [Flavobacteriales bacterium]|nr:hypothetical protein [Flavobacteriales bacterium]